MNQQTRMIMVEGEPFTGKSTTSEYIATQLNLNGYAAFWVSEGMLLQRYFPQAMAMLDRQQPVSETVLRAEWSAFVETVRAADTIFVVDSALSYAAVDLLLMEDRPVEAIHAETRHIADLCAPLQPRVIHLTGDAARLVPASIDERGERWRKQLIDQSEAVPYQQARGRVGIEGAISLMRDAQALVHEVLTRGVWETLTLDVMTPDWSARQRAILAFLGLDEKTVDRPTISPSVLRTYTGTYASDDPNRVDRELSVQLANDVLTVFAPGQRYGTLLPVSETRFHLQSSPLDVEFVIENGSVQAMMLQNSEGKTHLFRRI